MTPPNSEVKRRAGAIRFIVTLAVLLVLTLFVGCNASSHFITVKSGEVGIKIKNVGAGAGTQLNELPQGTHVRGFFEEIIRYPVRARIYSYTAEANGDGKENEEIVFADKTGLPVAGDVQMTVQVRRDKAADLYDEYKLTFDQLLETPIRNDIRSAIAKEAEKVPVSCNLGSSSSIPGQAEVKAEECPGSLMGAGRQAILSKAFIPVQVKWAAKGVNLTDLQWVGSLRYPAAITDAIKERTRIEQATLAAQQLEAQERAKANAKIEAARGDAESTRLKAQAIDNAPKLIEKIYADRSQGLCPPGTRTCIIGSMPTQMIPPNDDSN